MNDVILTIEQAAEYLKLSRDTLYRYAQSGKVPASRIGKHWRFSQANLAAWVRSSGTAEEASGSMPGVPMAAVSPSVSGGGDEPVPDSEAMDILIVDDDVAIGKLLCAWIQRMGHRPTLAENGTKAIGLLGERAFDLVFLDLFLGDMTGDRVLARLPQACPPPVVMISGMPGSAAMDAAMSYPVAYALAKPFTREEVVRVVRMLAVDTSRMAG